MKSEKRITKRQMKEDRLVSTTFKATEYIQKNQTPFIIGTVAILIVFALVVLLRWNADRRRTESADILTQSEITAAMGDMDQYMASLRMLSDNYGGTTAGKIATLRLANNAFDMRDFVNAETYFKRILDRYSDDKVISASAAAGIGASLEMREDFIGAGEYYLRAADYSDGELWAANYLYKAGINFAKAGERDKAAAALNRIEEKYQNSPEYNPARRVLAEITH
jgi:predicted negative regulator of RcsB-dependent stress response